ncbi:MAG: phosphoserine phosphatase SerB [Deltaproteobacteria bacterium]|nr:MAG: phosphoserine phosphatase SerB [Deltaproteobacteria bacterium]
MSFHPPTASKRYLAITATGRDRPGITAAITRVIAEAGLPLLEVEQATLQDLLALSFLVDLEPAAESKAVFKDLLFAAWELGVTLDFKILTAGDLIDEGERTLYVLTCLGEEAAGMLAAVSQIVAGENANIVSIRTLARTASGALELLIDTGLVPSMAKLRQRLLRASTRLGFDMALQREEDYRRSKRLVVFDMDSTLIENELIVELAKAAGVAEGVAEITEGAMRGAIDFERALRHRVALLEGLSLEKIEAVLEGVRLSHGVEELITVLRRLGFKIAVISGGFDILTRRLEKRLGLDYAFANRLEIEEGRLTGRIEGEIIDDLRKAQLVEEIARAEGIGLDQVVAIGDGANDILMLGRAGLGIAYNAKEIVRKAADASVAARRMSNILYLLGVTERDLANLTQEPR